ncbi:hypothetical protein A1F97_03012 [Pyrenophora tritici-repentis]|nr:hypothetical protein PtrSN001A_002898 [Pyrenophora tritici-repentis]KAI1561353.1 hypothetical protein PtrEW4_010654 [Pyrenophora tritici-repentis]KAI1583520.1 hypothetical protein PtrEW7m1_003287 [Pyrenophora tritici-repentis]KAI1593316.1 hypothetical protein PtrEW13061_003146 [Pyrenophora tritici-repentis]PWO27780.1 hypothetical protein PtrARCrB10_03664 [Pyrenophora tritici-repentis]
MSHPMSHPGTASHTITETQKISTATSTSVPITVQGAEIPALSTVATTSSSTTSFDGPLDDTRSAIPVHTIYTIETQPTILALPNPGSPSSGVLMSWNPHASSTDTDMETSSVIMHPMVTSLTASLGPVIHLDWSISPPSYTPQSSIFNSVSTASPTSTPDGATLSVNMSLSQVSSTPTVTQLLSHSFLSLPGYLSLTPTVAVVVDSSDASPLINTTVSVDTVTPISITVPSKQAHNEGNSLDLPLWPHSMLNSIATVDRSPTLALETHTGSLTPAPSVVASFQTATPSYPTSSITNNTLAPLGSSSNDGFSSTITSSILSSVPFSVSSTTSGNDQVSESTAPSYFAAPTKTAIFAVISTFTNATAIPSSSSDLWPRPITSTVTMVPGNDTASFSRSHATPILGTNSQENMPASTSYRSATETNSPLSYGLTLSMRNTPSFTISQNLSTSVTIQPTSVSEGSYQSSAVFTRLSTNGSYTPTTVSIFVPPFPAISTSSKFGISSFITKASGSSTLPTFTAKSTTLATRTSLSTFEIRTKTQSSGSSTRTGLIPQDIAVTATETAFAAAAPPLNTSQTAGVALGSTAGVLLAIVAALFVARRYHATHAVKRASKYNPVMSTKGGPGSSPNMMARLVPFASRRKSGRSSRVYLEEAYLYDPSLGGNSGRNSGDDEACMSGGTGGLLSHGIRPPPPAPHTSFEDDHRPSVYDYLHSGPGTPLRSPGNPSLNWRSSDAIGKPRDHASALYAAIADYGAGPQRPLPPVPKTSSTRAIRDHVIPSPTLSPLINNECELRRSHARSSSRSSVRSQRSLRSFHACTSPNPASKDYPPLSPYGRISGQGLGSIIEASSREPFMYPGEPDLPLRVLRSETPDSVTFYAPIPVQKPRKRPVLTTLFSQTSCTVSPLFSPTHAKSPPAAKPRSTGSMLFSRPDDSSYSSLTQDVPSSPAYLQRPNSDHVITYPASMSPRFQFLKPQNKGWEDIKRSSNRSSTITAPLPTPTLQYFTPPHADASPPAPLKKRSFLNLGRNTPLTADRQAMSSQNPYSTLAFNASFTYNNSNASFEGPRMSLFAKLHGMNEEQGSLKKKTGVALVYRGSVEAKKEMAPKWSPDAMGSKF